MDNLMVENICRICLQCQDTLFSLYRKIKRSSPYEKLVSRTLLKIEINDTGPSSICSQCLIELDTTVNFLNKCEQSNQILSAHIQAIEKIEVDIGDAKDVEQALFLESSSSNTRAVQCIRPEMSCKAEESAEDESGEPVVCQAPAVPDPARCPECGSRRRCRHWAPPATHTCPYCQKVFNRKFNFQLHLKRHSGERSWACASCGAAALTRSLAAAHCAPRRRRACPQPGCGKSFTTATNLTTHLRVHSGERPHVCTECGKTFTCKSTLNTHTRIHTGVKPYICPVCGRQFATNKLSAHMRTHSGARPHACPAPACARAFRCARALRLHAATHLPPKQAHACRACPAAYRHAQEIANIFRLPGSC